jgi:5-methyltetrahydropteroyltriglutamate--homocysteine methyltransferase
MDYLNALHVDHIVMECAHRPDEDLIAFKELRPEIGMGLGVVDVKRTMTESPDDIARLIERAESIMGEGRVTYIHPDCGLWNHKRYIADRKIGVLNAGRDLYLGRESAAVE